MLLKYTLFCCSFCCLISCSDSSTITNSQQNTIIGEWQWNRTDGGIGGWHYTPASEGYTCKITFFDRSNCSLYRNDSLVQSGTYTITSSNLSISGFIQWQPNIVFNGEFSIAHDSLIFSDDGIYDGLSSLYIRK